MCSSMLYFQGNVINVQNWLKGDKLYIIPVDNLTRNMNETLLSHIKMAERERKIQPTAVPLDTLPERCTMTMHHEISARGSLMPAGDGSAVLSDTLSPTRQ